jgi:hypothetical protein
MANLPESRWKSRSKHDLIIEVWEALDCESVGATELERIQQALLEKFGEGGLESPASIARTVADEGAVLRHPEVFELDFSWRERNGAKAIFQQGLDFSDLSSAFIAIVRIEEMRLQLQADKETKGLKELRGIVLAARSESLLRARSKIIDEDQRRQAREISEWLNVWLQAPELFSDWLDLRRRSPEFQNRFPDYQNENSPA